MRVEFFMQMVPPTVTHQEKRVRFVKGRPMFYEDDRLKAARKKLLAYLAQHKPERPLIGAVRLAVYWWFPIVGNHHEGEPKTSKPDTDNLQKLLKDCMTTVGFWKDDAQVYMEVSGKFWSARPGITIVAEEVEV